MTKLKLIILKIKLRLFPDLNEIHYINGAENLPPPLSKEDEQKALELLKIGNNKGRELLIIHNLRLVVYIAKRFESTGIGIEDLVSIGTIGLIKAVKTFNSDKNIKLATYASRCIENEILMHLRKTTQHKNDISIDEPLNFDADGNELLLSDILGTDSDMVVRGIESEVEISLLLKEISKLSPREKQIMEMRFGLGKYKKELTQKQVADIVGISQSYISRLEKRIIKQLKENLEKIC